MMEPASLAFGVVSLGMQLVQAAAAIRAQIDAYKSAAKELSALSDKLDDIEAICYSLEAAFNCCDQAPKPWDAVMLKKLHKIMSDCRDKVSLLYEVISKITSNQSTRRISLNTVGARFLQHRSTIRRCNDGLDQTLTSLHLHMTTNILVMNLRPSTQTRDSVSLTIHTPSESETRDSGSLSTEVVKRQRKGGKAEIQTHRWGWSYLPLYRLEWTKEQKVKQVSDDPPSSTVQEESTFLVGSPLLGLYAKFSVQRGSLSPLCISLRFPHVFTFKEHSCFLTDIGRVLRSNNVAEFQKLLDKYSLTPATSLYLLDSTSNETDTLLGLAIFTRAHRIHDFLIDQCPGLLHERHHLPLKYDMLYGSGSLWDPGYDFSCTRTYIDTRGDALTPSEFFSLLFGVTSATHVSSCVEACKSYFSEEWEPFNCCLWTTIFHFCLDSSIVPYPGPEVRDQERDMWVSLMKQAISDGVDVHSNVLDIFSSYEDDFSIMDDVSTKNRLSALQNLFYIYGDIDEYLRVAHDWVEMLQQAGIDIDRYLEKEIKNIASIWDEFESDPDETSYRREFRVQQYKGRKFPSWATSFTASAAPELFSEFPHLVKEESFGYIYLQDGGPQPHRSWKNPIQVRGGIVRCPLERWSLNWHRDPLTERDRRLVDGFTYACDLMESRFQRKQTKKLRKAGYMYGFKALKLKDRIPGAWVD